MPKRAQPLMQSRRDEAFWYHVVSDSQTLYVQYNQVGSTGAQGTLADFAAALDEYLDTHDVARVVVDVRHNMGGDNTTYAPLLAVLHDHPKLKQPGKLFLITGRTTFLSAAANFSTDVERKTDAIFVGEGMGGSPNLYGDTFESTLPNSKLQVRTSAHESIKSTPDDKRLTIEPQIPITLSSADYFAERDPVFDAILKSQPKSPRHRIPHRAPCPFPPRMELPCKAPSTAKAPPP